jgi:TonB family protein
MKSLLLVCAIVLMSVELCAAEVERHEPTPAATERPLTLDEIDGVLERVTSSAWRAAEAFGHQEPAADGTTMEQDMDRYMWTEPALQRLKELRRELPASIPAGSELVPIEALRPLQSLVGAESCRSFTVYTTWMLMRVLDIHMQLIAPLAARLPASGQALWRERVSAFGAHRAAAHARLPTLVGSCETLPADDLPDVTAGVPEMFAEANQLRGELAAAIEALPVDAAAEPAWMMRPSACPASSGATTGTEQARVISRANPAEFYPDDAMGNTVEGRVTVIVDMDSTGCVTRTAVSRSSGAPDLDRAGMLMAFEMQLMPGEVDGKAVAGRFTQSITFSMRNDPPPPGGATQPQP